MRGEGGRSGFFGILAASRSAGCDGAFGIRGCVRCTTLGKPKRRKRRFFPKRKVYFFVFWVHPSVVP